jgi:hypothetical protein
LLTQPSFGLVGQRARLVRHEPFGKVSAGPAGANVEHRCDAKRDADES